MPVRPVEWIPDRPDSPLPGKIRLIDQTLLPTRLKTIDTDSIDVVHEAIRSLRVRGAPAIGVAAALGVLVAVQRTRVADGRRLLERVEKAAGYLAGTRPTAVNLFKALDHMRRAARSARRCAVPEMKRRLAEAALDFLRADRAMCRLVGEHGASLLGDGQTVLTHCNAGSLATSEYGTALAAIYVAIEQGKRIRVYADETRPLLQGARLTAWELKREGIDVTVICDSVAATVMRQKRIDAVLVGADRIAANGDTANKIGTYSVAVLAAAHRIPFYVLAPSSTFDMTLKSGDGIPIEERGADEVVRGFGRRTAPEGVAVYAPAFDVTPARLITAIVSEKGIARPDYRRSLPSIV